MVYVKILSTIALIGSIAWFISSPGFEPALAVVGSVSTMVSAFVIQKRSSRRLPQQHQSVSNSSVGVQAGRDVNIGAVEGKKHDE